MNSTGTKKLPASGGFAPSRSSTESLSVTSSIPPTPSVIISAPSTAPHAETVTLSVTLFDPTASTLNANVTLEITGRNNYVIFDVVQVKVNPNSQASGYYDWALPSQIGQYTVIVSLLPATPSIDIEAILVT